MLYESYNILTMKIARKLSKIGNSSGIIIPSKMLANVGISPKDEIELEDNGKVIIIYPRPKKPSMDKKVTEAMERFIKKYRYDLEMLAK